MNKLFTVSNETINFMLSQDTSHLHVAIDMVDADLNATEWLLALSECTIEALITTPAETKRMTIDNFSLLELLNLNTRLGAPSIGLKDSFSFDINLTVLGDIELDDDTFIDLSVTNPNGEEITISQVSVGFPSKEILKYSRRTWDKTTNRVHEFENSLISMLIDADLVTEHYKSNNSSRTVSRDEALREQLLLSHMGVLHDDNYEVLRHTFPMFVSNKFLGTKSLTVRSAKDYIYGSVTNHKFVM